MPDQAIEQLAQAARPSRFGRKLLFALVLVLLFAVAVALAARRIPAVQSYLDGLIGIGKELPSNSVAQSGASTRASSAALPGPANAPTALGTDMMAAGSEARIAQLEARLAQIDLQAQAASGNAARAEALLIAFAARRTLDRGAPLGYLEDQLKLRFADAQPNAVQTLIDAAHSPVTLDQLYSQLGVLKPKLTGLTAGEDTWARVKRELSGLFIIRRQAEVSVSPENTIAQAQMLLVTGKVGEAISLVQRMPGAAAAQPWLMAAQRYTKVQSALDLIETTAMLEPRRLKDNQGAMVEQASPLARPAATIAPALPAPAPTATSSSNRSADF